MAEEKNSRQGLSKKTHINGAGRVPGALLASCGVGLPGVVSDGSRRLGQRGNFQLNLQADAILRT